MSTNDSGTAAPIGAMAFYHPDGLVPSWTQAAAFAGEGGRVATLPDIVRARLATAPGQAPWEMYFTTASAEYYGRTPSGLDVVVVAHGIGPMATMDGAVAAYSYGFKDKTRQRQGGRISLAEFRRLLDGAYGPVDVVPVREVIALREYPFDVGLEPLQVLEDPLAVARLGGRELAELYVARHAVEAERWRAEEVARYRAFARSEDRGPGTILNMRQPSGRGCSYDRVETGGRVWRHFPAEVEGDVALAHLLSVGQLCNVQRREYGVGCLECDVHPHDWTDGTRFVGVREAAGPEGIHRGVDTGWAMANARDLMMVDTGLATAADGEGFHTLKRLRDGSWFTLVPKRGVALDTGEPEFPVAAIEPVGEETTFTVETAGYYGIFRYALNDVRSVAPAGANAYALVGDGGVLDGGDRQWHGVQFYRVEVDRSRRMLRDSEVLKDFALMMRIAERRAS